MNPYSGEVVSGAAPTADFVEVPEMFHKAARRALGNRDSVFIKLNSNSKLAVFARAERKKDRNRRRGELAKASRKRNR